MGSRRKAACPSAIICMSALPLAKARRVPDRLVQLHRHIPHHHLAAAGSFLFLFSPSAWPLHAKWPLHSLHTLWLAPHCLCPLYDMAGSTVLVLPSPAFARVEPRGDPEAAEKTGQMGVDYFMCILAPGSMPSPSPILAPLCWSWNEALMEMLSVRISGAAANVE